MSTKTKTDSRNKKPTTVRSAVKTNDVRKKSTDKAMSISKKQQQKRKNNLLKLCSEMSKYADDANDKEIIKRFKTSITSAVNEDISKSSLNLILKNPEDVAMGNFSENIQPYLKHYLFMINRNKNKKK